MIYRGILPITALAASLGLPVPAAGQAPSGTDASALMARMMRAQRGGEAAAARNMADSVLSVLPLADERRADALFVRATTAPTPVAARTDWLRIVVDHPVSPRVEDALLALADLEWKAGDRAAATRHLQRLVGVGLTTERSVREAHRQGVQLLQGNEARLGCAVLETARTQVPAGQVEQLGAALHRKRVQGIAEGPPPLGILLGTLAARWHGSWTDRAVMAFSVMGVSVPVFWIGLLLIQQVGGRGWLPFQEIGRAHV